MRGNILRLIELGEALQIIQSSLRDYEPRVERAVLTQMSGRTLAEDVYAPIDIPPYDKSALDGYAVKTRLNSAVTPGSSFRIVGRHLACDENPPQIGEGEALYVSTGSRLPSGTTAVVRIEEAREKSGELQAVREISPGKNIVRAGSDVRRGDLVLRRGRVLTPFDEGLLGGLGVESVSVVARPRVTVISVGSEHLKSTGPRYQSNNYSLIIAGLIKDNRGEVSSMDVSPDDERELEGLIRRRLGGCDLIVTIGGCSVGIDDVVPRTIREMRGASLLFHGLRVHPCKPAGYGIVDGKPLLMLPGHIVSAVSAFYLLGSPIMSTLSGTEGSPFPLCIDAVCTRDVTPKPGMGYFTPVELTRRGGQYYATPMGWATDSLRNLVNAHGYILLSRGESIKAGEVVRVSLFNNYVVPGHAGKCDTGRS